jgi:hypothetical protein
MSLLLRPPVLVARRLRVGPPVGQVLWTTGAAVLFLAAYAVGLGLAVSWIFASPLGWLAAVPVGVPVWCLGRGMVADLRG